MSNETKSGIVTRGDEIGDALAELMGSVSVPDSVEDGEGALQGEIESEQTTKETPEDSSSDETIQSEADETGEAEEEETDSSAGEEEGSDDAEEGDKAPDEETEEASSDEIDSSEESEEEGTEGLSELEVRLKESEERTAKLLKALETGNVGLTPVSAPADEAQSAAPAPSIPPLAPQTLSDEDFEQVMSSKEKFLEVVNNAVQIGRQQTMQELSPTVSRIFTNKMKVERFFDSNPTLGPIRKLVTDRAVEIEAATPGITIKDALTQAGEHLREALMLGSADNVSPGDKPNQVKVRRTTKRTVPPQNKFAKSTSRRKPVVKKEGGEVDVITRQIEELAELGT